MLNRQRKGGKIYIAAVVYSYSLMGMKLMVFMGAKIIVLPKYFVT